MAAVSIHRLKLIKKKVELWFSKLLLIYLNEPKFIAKSFGQ
jgi:hypothetical protein